MGEAELTAQKCQAWVWVNLDEDGTPLDQHGERMVETAPGVWQEQIVVDILDFLEKSERARSLIARNAETAPPPEGQGDGAALVQPEVQLYGNLYAFAQWTNDRVGGARCPGQPMPCHSVRASATMLTPSFDAFPVAGFTAIGALPISAS